MLGAMTGADTFNETLSEILTDQGASLTGVDPSETVGPRVESGGLDLQAGLRDFGEVLGAGGMGVVRVATHHPLHRTVAVKSLRDPEPHPSAVRHLLHEALVAGLLDHPNILPIHDIVIDAAGRPHIVMKRVEGEPWSAWAHDRQRIRDELGARDPLAWNLGILIQVCNAVAYAHDKGILHRDLKPANVMIGAFGEVLVLDWGVAVALDDRYGDRIPRVCDQRRIAGTPRYMSPELALGRGDRQGPASDVYLLGGMLYFLLAGHAPHRGASIAEVLAAIPTARPFLGDHVPGALARIVERAMAFEPEDRFPSALAFRDEVHAFLEHRSSVRLARQAGRSLDLLEAQLEDPAAERSAVHRLFDETRFGFEQALAEWSDNPFARDGLRRARTAMARWELSRDEPGTAAALLEALPDPPTELLAEVRRAEVRRRERHAELAALRADSDPRVGQRTRLFVLALVGLVWVGTPALYGVMRPEVRWWQLLASSFVPLALVLGLGVWARDSLSRTALNRVSWLTMALVPPAQIVLDATAMTLGLTPTDALMLRPALWGAMTAMFAIVMMPRLLPAAAVFAVVSLAGPRWPSALPWTATGANLVLVGLLFWIWWTPGSLHRDR